MRVNKLARISGSVFATLVLIVFMIIVYSAQSHRTPDLSKHLNAELLANIDTNREIFATQTSWLDDHQIVIFEINSEQANEVTNHDANQVWLTCDPNSNDLNCHSGWMAVEQLQALNAKASLDSATIDAEVLNKHKTLEEARDTVCSLQTKRSADGTQTIASKYFCLSSDQGLGLFEYWSS